MDGWCKRVRVSWRTQTAYQWSCTSDRAQKNGQRWSVNDVRSKSYGWYRTANSDDVTVIVHSGTISVVLPLQTVLHQTTNSDGVPVIVLSRTFNDGRLVQASLYQLVNTAGELSRRISDRAQ